MNQGSLIPSPLLFGLNFASIYDRIQETRLFYSLIVIMWFCGAVRSWIILIDLHLDTIARSHRETEEKTRRPETKLGAIAQTRHIARLCNAKRSRTKHPKPTHGARDRPKQPQLRAGETAHRGPASNMRRDVRARPTQGRVAPAHGNAKLPERPRDEGGPRETRPASLLPVAWSAKSPSSVRAGAPRCPKDSTDIGTKGRAEDTCRYARRLEASQAASANPGVRAAPTAKEAAAWWMTETSPTTSQRGNTNMTSPRAPGPRGGGTPRGSGDWAPGPGEGAESAGSVKAAAGASAGASGTSTGRPETQPPEEEASAGSAGGKAGGEERAGKKRKGGSAKVWTPARAAIQCQLVLTKSWRDDFCWARQVQVRG
jgi:hypothetical protein